MINVQNVSVRKKRRALAASVLPTENKMPPLNRYAALENSPPVS